MKAFKPSPNSVLFVMPIIGHPRHSKRIEMIKNSDFHIQITAFERDYHQGRLPNFPITKMGTFTNGKYLDRIVKLILALPTLRGKIKQSDISYCFGVDMTLISLISGLGLKKPVIMEIGDIREIQVRTGILGKAVRLMDRWLTAKCAVLIATTPMFVTQYYRKWIKSNVDAIVIENKLEKKYVQHIRKNHLQQLKKFSRSSNAPITIGYFGGLRCMWSWKTLEALARTEPDRFKIIFAGFPMDPHDLPTRSQQHANMEFLGQYKSPDDLHKLYASVDIVWGCYQPIKENDWNLKWARPNRFYESCLFHRPLITRAGSCDAVDVKKYGIGHIVNSNSPEDASASISVISRDTIAEWKANMNKVPLEKYCYTDEEEILGSKIREILLMQSH